jgi:hypothetical protein
MDATPAEIQEALMVAMRELAELDGGGGTDDPVAAVWYTLATTDYGMTVAELKKLARPAECGEAILSRDQTAVVHDCDFRPVPDCVDMWFCHRHYVVHDCSNKQCRTQHQTPEGDSVCLLTAVARYDPVCWGTNFLEAPTTLVTRSRSQPRSEASRLRKREHLTNMLFGDTGRRNVAACLDAMLALRPHVIEPSYTRERRDALAGAMHEGFRRMFRGQTVGVNALLGYVQLMLTYMCGDAPGYVLHDTVCVVPDVPWLRDHIPANTLQLSSAQPVLHTGNTVKCNSHHSSVVARYIVARVDATPPSERAALAFPQPATGTPPTTTTRKRKSDGKTTSTKRQKRSV